MTQELKDAVVIGPDAEIQLIETQSGDLEIRLRSERSRAAVVRDQQQIIELIQGLAGYATELE